MKNDKRPLMDTPDSNRWRDYLGSEWESLSSKDKATCISYARALRSSKAVSTKLVSEINSVHARNPGFHMGHVPESALPDTSAKGKLLNFPEYQTLDFSDYLANGTED